MTSQKPHKMYGCGSSFLENKRDVEAHPYKMYGRRTTSLSRSWHTHPGVPALVRCKRLNQREKETSNSRERHGIAAHRRETGASAVWAYCPVDAIGTLPNRSASRPLMGFGPVFDNATFLPEAADGLGSTHVLRPLVRFDNSALSFQPAPLALQVPDQFMPLQTRDAPTWTESGTSSIKSASEVASGSGVGNGLPSSRRH